MTTLTVTFDQPLAGPAADELGRRLFFASGDILDFAFVRCDGAVTGVDLTVTPAGDAAQVARKVRAVLDDDVLTQLARPPKVVWRSADRRPVADGTFDRLVRAGQAYPAGEGQVTLGPALLALADALDAALRTIVVDRFGARQFRYPTLIRASTLHRSGYLTSFPQYLMFATRLHSDLDGYRHFVDDVRAGDGLVPDVLDRCAGVDYCLPPTMCYHTFAQYADGCLPEGVAVVTAAGKSFRHEEKYHRGLERLWDFTIREVVFLGDRDSVRRQRQELLAQVLDLVDALDLVGHCEVANDPFFGHADVAARSSSQRLLELKYELRLDIGEGRTVAAGSFNLHERTFGSAFMITLPDGQIAHTACAGFGLERLAYAFACQHGLEPDAWPRPVRAILTPGVGRRPTRNNQI
jgi:seryl-tRNA synthetase